MIRFILRFVCSLTFLFSQPNWIYRYNGSGNGADWSNSITYGDDGNIYAGGISAGSGTCTDHIIVSLQPCGEANWVYRYDSTGYFDGIRQIIYGSDGNIYSAGDINWDLFSIQSVSRAGALNWTYTDAGSGECSALAIDCDDDANTYAAGYMFREYNEYDYVVAGIDSTGGEKWIIYIDGEGNDYDAANSVVCSPDGYVYSAGYTTDTAWIHIFSVARHNSQTGITEWIDHYTPGNAKKLVCGPDSSIYALGTLNNNCAIRKYRSNGAIAWTRTFNASIATIIYATDGNIYGCGSIDTAGTGDDIMVLSLNPNNNLNWIMSYPDTGDSWANSIVYGLDEKLYIGGFVSESNSGDAVVLCLSTAGDTNWVHQYNGPGDGEDCILDIAYGRHNQVYASGYSAGISNTRDFIVMCFNTLAVEEMDSKTIFGGNFLTVNPNPCFQKLNISLCLADPDKPISLRLFDITGRPVCNILENQISTLPVIEYPAPSDMAAGVYYLVLETANSKYMRKLVFLR